MTSRPTGVYYRGDRSELLSWLGGSYQRVLEIGCGEGGNAAWLREHGSTRIVGIEIDQSSAEKARRVFDTVLNLPVEDALPALDEQFDLIICADVLEHLLDPWAAVRSLADRAVPGGALVASVPNVRFVLALWEIAFGRGFAYSTEGLFDRTHLRFFARRNIEELFTAGTWQVNRWGYSKGRRRTLAWLREGLWRLTGGRSGEYLAYQWFVAATLGRAPTRARET